MIGSTGSTGLTEDRQTGGQADETLPHLVGEPVQLPGVIFAPVNEAGVVHLFGLLFSRHGIAVEHMGTAYPDCRGLRKEKGDGGRWRRIAVEFELKSSNFRAHGHDPALCDVIVCWEDDWKDCPIEVVALKSLLATGAEP